MKLEDHPDVKLTKAVKDYYADPLGYVMFAFPWGKPGTILEHHKGPCPCQQKLLSILGEEIRKRNFDGKTPVKPIRIAVASGHGIGKSAFFGMINNFILSTRTNAIGTVTASTFTQLSTKTWAAITAWNKLSITGHWFEVTTDRAYRIGKKESWFSSAQTCSEENSQAFAGQHANTSTSYYLNDEASGIPDKIFEVQRGGLTDGEPMQFVFGNLTEPLGEFARIMRGDVPHWITVRIDSRECPLTNKQEIQDLIDECGEDSDVVRVRVRGLPPRAAAAQFIGDDLVSEAEKRTAYAMADEPLIAGVDFAWGGDDSNCIRFRCGLDAKSIPPIHIPGEFTRKPEVMVTKLSEILSKTYNGRKVSMLFTDSAGIAGPVTMRLRLLGFQNIIDVNFNGHSPEIKYKNARSYMWGKMREWLERGMIDKSKDLFNDLTAPEVLKHVPLLLERKEDIIKRIGKSTDDGDALALTFYMEVSPEGVKTERLRRNRVQHQVIGAWT